MNKRIPKIRGAVLFPGLLLCLLETVALGKVSPDSWRETFQCARSIGTIPNFGGSLNRLEPLGLFFLVRDKSLYLFHSAFAGRYDASKLFRKEDDIVNLRFRYSPPGYDRKKWGYLYFAFGKSGLARSPTYQVGSPKMTWKDVDPTEPTSSERYIQRGANSDFRDADLPKFWSGSVDPTSKDLFTGELAQAISRIGTPLSHEDAQASAFTKEALDALASCRKVATISKNSGLIETSSAKLEEAKKYNEARKSDAKLLVFSVSIPQRVKVGQPFRAKTVATNSGTKDFFIPSFTCSWFVSWTFSNPNITWSEPWDCMSNIRTVMTVPAGGSYEKELSLKVQKKKSREERFQIVLGQNPPIRSEELTILVDE